MVQYLQFSNEQRLLIYVSNIHRRLISGTVFMTIAVYLFSSAPVSDAYFCVSGDIRRIAKSTEAGATASLPVNYRLASLARAPPGQQSSNPGGCIPADVEGLWDTDACFSLQISLFRLRESLSGSGQ